MKFFDLSLPAITIAPGFSIDSHIPNGVHVDNRICSKFYPSSSLVVGQYTPTLFTLEDVETANEQIIDFAKQEGLYLPGAQGMISLAATNIAFDQRKIANIPVSDTVVFPDIKEHLYKKDGAWRVPYMNLEDPTLRLHVMKWKAAWYKGKMVCLFRKV